MNAQFVVPVVNSLESAIPGRSNGGIQTQRHTVGYLRVAQWVHLWIHILVLMIQFDNSIFTKSPILQSIMSFCNDLQFVILNILECVYFHLYCEFLPRKTVNSPVMS
jgi:hypothetical protein